MGETTDRFIQGLVYQGEPAINPEVITNVLLVLERKR
jgi:hypothetical protein